MSNRLTTASDWKEELGLSDAQWDALVRDCEQHFRQGGRDSLWQLAERHALTPRDMMAVAKSQGMVQAVQELRNALADDCFMLATASRDLLIDHFNDPGKRGKIAAREAGTLLKQMSDTSIALRDGKVAGSPVFNVREMKAVFALKETLGNEFKPVPVEQKDGPGV